MDPDFVVQVKYTIFWLNIGLRVYLDLYAPDFSKTTSKYLFVSVLVYHGLCLKGRPWSCGHLVGGSLTDHLTEQTRTDMSAKPATGVE